MKKDWIARELTMEIVVGVFIVMIFLGMCYFTIILSRETWFGPKTTMEVQFEDVMGLREGDSVVARGMPVGKVKGMKLANRGVAVVVSLDQGLDMREDYKIQIISTSILGGRYMEIDEGGEDSPKIDSHGVFIGETPYDLMGDAAALVNAARSELVEGGVFSNLHESAQQLHDVIARVSEGKGTLGRLLSEDDTLYEDLTAVMSDLRSVSDRLAKGQGTLGRLMSEDDTLYEDLSAGVASLRSIAERLERGEGTAGKLLSGDDTLYEDLAATAASLRDITGKIERGEGAVGKLMGDSGLYDELEGIVKDARAALDDYRETSPVVTFTSIIFGAF